MASEGIGSTLLGNALELGITHGVPWLAKKGLEAGRYYASEAMRNPRLQQKAIDYAIKKGKPLIHEAGKAAINQLSYYVRPPRARGKGIDIHKAIGKLPRPKAGFTPGKYKFMGPYNPLDKQLRYDPQTGEVIEWKVKPHNRVDEIAAYHDICYDMGKNKGECDREMVKSLDKIAYGEMPKWGQTARFLINTKQKLGLGVAKNGKRRSVIVIGLSVLQMSYTN